jgi:hypothetical protein
MTIEGDRSVSPSRPSGQPLPPPDEMPSTARQKSDDVAQTAKEAGRDVMSEMSDQVSSVAGTAKQQVDTLMSRARDELTQQAETRGQQTISAVRSWGGQLQALADGRPEGAGELLGFVREAQLRVQSYADSLERRGPRAFVDDVSAFARRRPAVFLMAAGFAGFAIGRLVRSGAQQDSPQTGRIEPDGFTSFEQRPAQSTRPFDEGRRSFEGAGGVVTAARTP